MASQEQQEEKPTRPTLIQVFAATGLDRIAEERVRLHAYRIYEERQHAGVAGDSVSDWLRAQSELNQMAHPS